MCIGRYILTKSFSYYLFVRIVFGLEFPLRAFSRSHFYDDDFPRKLSYFMTSSLLFARQSYNKHHNIEWNWEKIKSVMMRWGVIIITSYFSWCHVGIVGLCLMLLNVVLLKVLLYGACGSLATFRNIILIYSHDVLKSTALLQRESWWPLKHIPMYLLRYSIIDLFNQSNFHPI